MLRNTAPGEGRRVRVNKAKNGKAAPKFEPKTRDEVAYSAEKTRRSYEQELKHAPRNQGTWLKYIKFEGEKSPRRALQVTRRALKMVPCVDVYLQLMKYDPSQTLEALRRYPNSCHIRKRAFDQLNFDDARVKLAEWVEDDPSWFEVFIDIETQVENYDLVSKLFRHWSSTFGTDTTLWSRALNFELKHGTHQGFLEISAMALRALFFSNPKNKPSGRIKLFLYFLKNCKWSPQDCKSICTELQKLDLTPLEVTYLRREVYRHNLLEKGITETQLRKTIISGTSILRRSKHIDEDGIRFLFESHLVSTPPPPDTSPKLWAFEFVDYAEYCNDLETYQRVLALCPSSAILINSFVKFAKANLPKPQYEELILECLKTHAKWFPTDLVLDFELVKASPETYRPFFYTRLSTAITFLEPWFAVIELEELCGKYDTSRSLFELALDEIKSWKKPGNEALWQKYANFEYRRGTLASYTNVLRRWFKNQCTSSPLLWDEMVAYWYQRHGKRGVQGALYAASQITKGAARQDHIQRAMPIKRKYNLLS